MPNTANMDTAHLDSRFRSGKKHWDDSYWIRELEPVLAWKCAEMWWESLTGQIVWPVSFFLKSILDSYLKRLIIVPPGLCNVAFLTLASSQHHHSPSPACRAFPPGLCSILPPPGVHPLPHELSIFSIFASRLTSHRKLTGTSGHGESHLNICLGRKCNYI